LCAAKRLKKRPSSSSRLSQTKLSASKKLPCHARTRFSPTRNKHQLYRRSSHSIVVVVKKTHQHRTGVPFFFCIDTEYVSSSLSFCHAVHGPQGTGHTFHANSDGRHANDANPLSFIMYILYMYMTHTHTQPIIVTLFYAYIYIIIYSARIYISFICIGTRKTQILLSIF